VGQQATTLPGGEAQRVKLSKELSRRATGRTLYILDEPTTGLHFHDVKKLLEVLHELVEQGNTVVVIEHNLEVIKTADWVIDLGPEGGDGGGEIVAVGPPEAVAANPRSHTGHFLAEVLARRPNPDGGKPIASAKRGRAKSVAQGPASDDAPVSDNPPAKAASTTSEETTDTKAQPPRRRIRRTS
jgi:excinuclease ABC subunit A